ncbi:hypothetical protein Nos7107_1098 [Nostoc sp. PCC 7107]|nr:hypothetical protein Nos7107_1098 [Nostoc sp. PCC 7107]
MRAFELPTLIHNYINKYFMALTKLPKDTSGYIDNQPLVTLSMKVGCKPFLYILTLLLSL